MSAISIVFTMTVSIALCTYNGARFITEQLESICNQTVQPNEIVICDDLSTDETLSCIEEVKNSYPAIDWKIRRNTANLGYVKNFEQAVSLTTGDIIFLSDQDDVWLPEKVEKLVDYLKKEKEKELVFSNSLISSSTLQSYNQTMFERTEFTLQRMTSFKNGGSFKLLLSHFFVTGATVAFKSSLKKWILPFADVERHIHDGWMAIVAGAMDKIGFVNESLVLYRQHEGQTMGYIGLDKMVLEVPDETEAAAQSTFFTKLYSTGYFKERLKRKNEFLRHDMALLQEINKRSLPVTYGNKKYLQRRIQFYKMQTGFTANRWQRLLPIVRNLFNGNYRLFDGSVTKKPVNDLLMKIPG